ncbi:MAG TPA: glycosyltransferase [Gemmatimonadales bacterium]|nr:glycosyltransferase [Gemmatimonadales bacterium]
MTVSTRPEIVHLAHSFFPADPRVKREAIAAASTGRAVAVVALREPGRPDEEPVGPLKVIRLPGTKSRGGPLTYLWEYLSFIWRCRRLLATDQRFQGVRIVHVHALPDFLVWAATPARRRGARIILDLHEIFPEFTVSKFPGVTGRLFGVVAQRLERQARRRADVTITVNKPIAALLGSRGIGRPERLVLIHNSADPADFGPMRIPDAHARPRPGVPLELVYHGTLTHLYGLDVAIRGVALASTRGTAVHLTILGDGQERDALGRLVTDLHATNAVTFESHVPQDALRERLTLTDGGIVPTRLDGMTRYSLSNKLLDYVHLGIPVLAARLPSYAAYLPDNAAWFWDPEDPEHLAATIGEFAAATADDRRARPIRAQRALQDVGWDRERARLIEIYTSLLSFP